MTAITSPEGIKFIQLCARIGALRLETKGMRRNGRSAYSICKEVYGLKGSKVSVLRQLEAMKEKILEGEKKQKPRHVHECEECKFLGHYDEYDTKYDLYYCPQQGLPTVLARYGNDSYEYTSGLHTNHQALVEAEKLAIKAGYLEVK